MTPSLTQSRCQLILANAPSTPQISLPSRSGHTALRCCDFLAQLYILRDLSICTLATASVELCSPCGEVPWKNHPSFPVAPQRPPLPLVSPQPGVRMLSSRLWRVSRQALPFLSLPLRSACAQIHRLNSRMISIS